MNLSLKHLYLILIFFSYSIISIAGTVYSKSSTDWDNPNTWNTGVVPGINDDVFIDGHKVTIDAGTFFVNSLTVTNISASGKSELHMEGSGKLQITNDLYVDAPGHDSEVKIHLLDNSYLEVLRQTVFTRGISNTTNNRLILDMSEASKFKVHGNFIYNYSNSGNGENNNEIYMKSTSILEVIGNMIINISGGRNFMLDIRGNTKTLIGGNLEVNATGGEDAYFYFSGSNLLTISEDILIANSGTPNVTLEISNASGSQVVGDMSLISSSQNNGILVCNRK